MHDLSIRLSAKPIRVWRAAIVAPIATSAWRLSELDFAIASIARAVRLLREKYQNPSWPMARSGSLPATSLHRFGEVGGQGSGVVQSG